MLAALARYHGFSKSATLTSLVKKEFWRVFPGGTPEIRPDRGARIDVVLRHGVPAVRPDDVLSGMAAVAGLESGEGVLLTRLAQGRLTADGAVEDPLA